MTENEYIIALNSAFKRLSDAAIERSNLEAEITKLKQFILATMAMLSEEEHAEFREKLNEVTKSIDALYTPLSEATYNALRPREWMTVTQVRDQLRISGFDFSQYKASELASISTTLKRLNDKGEVEKTTVDGVAAYRRKRKESKYRRMARGLKFGEG